MKKVLTIVGVVLAVAVIAVTATLVTRKVYTGKLEQMSSQVALLNANLEAIGDIVTCYTVQSATYPGQEITEDLIVEQSIPESLRNDTFASRADLVGMYCKVAITPGTPITTDMVMTEVIEDSMREIDISANRWPIGLREGDYIDLRITYPRGEDYIVLSHKRVMSITEQTLKVYMTEDEQILYQAALVDFYLSRSYGSDLYFTKYVEPGIQDAAVTFYSVPANIAATAKLDPNIIHMAELTVQEALRANIDAALAKFADSDSSGSDIKGGRDELNSKVNSDFATYEVEVEAEAAAAADTTSDAESMLNDITVGVG